MAGLSKTREMVLHANNFKVIDHCELALPVFPNWQYDSFNLENVSQADCLADSALVCLILKSLNCWDCPKKQPVTINKSGQN